MPFYQCLDGSDLLLRKALILRQRNDWLKPELRFSVRTLNVNVHANLFAGEKSKTDTARRGIWLGSRRRLYHAPRTVGMVHIT
jgi:hypothetical protein